MRTILAILTPPSHRRFASRLLSCLLAHLGGPGLSQARRLHRLVLGKSPSPRDEEASLGSKANRFVARMLAIGSGMGFEASLNESSARRLLKPHSDKERSYLDEIELRTRKRRTGSRAAL